ncbi:MAG: spermidine/putrescine ABC transporter substrate-binding protein [Thermoleophilia bacterium]
MARSDKELRVAVFDGLQKPITRRSFLRKTGAAGLLVAGAGWLAACGDEEETSGGGGEEQLADQLNFYNWSDYIAEDTIPNFEEEYGVRVVYDNYSSNDQLLAKLQSGATGYDIVVPSDYMLSTMLELDLIQPINLDNIPNVENLYQRFREAPYDPGNQYSIPWQWGTTGIGYNMDNVPDFRPSWEMMWNADYSGKITMLTEIRDLFAVALFRLGYDINTTDEAKINEAKELLIEQKPLLKHYSSDTYIDELASGDSWLSHGWSGDVFQAAAENEAVAYAIPEEGAVIWVDSMCVPKDAPHKYTAEVFMNYILEPEVGAAITNYVWYASPNEAAEEFIDPEILNDPSIYPTAEVEERLEFIQELGEATTLYNDAFAEIQAA